ncbi:hypothetical protein AQI88_20320 [Streptomyces cellostaticus]|uniref:DUF3592 domain-containing protein n=1 Tax=Streptomyces cellostaticus TaxID=67285 RepID=A0A101NKA9_9ACTN|nr:DUF3592 domain-containing protein [Streptomyces cellostaticus]KUM94544.1 hypothetical protein AQI88_20320 [Streptomyces cellostaticus]GHI07450.1 hypothetical protein Scel_57710 [Streptomyces cellostaticus]
MEAFFYIVPAIMIAIVLFAACNVLGRSHEISRAWESGLTAEARCLNAYTTTSGGGQTSVSTTLHHVYEFTTREGRAVRFEEQNGPSTIVQGDIVTVHYAADRPEKATAKPPAPGKLAAGTGCLLAFFAVFAAGCIAFMIGVHTAFSMTDDFMP